MLLCCLLQFRLQPLHSLTVSVSKTSCSPPSLGVSSSGEPAAVLPGVSAVPHHKGDEFEAVMATVGKQDERRSVKIPCVATFPN